MNLSTDLAQLENAELIRHLVEAEPAFVFKHPLTQASAYDSLLHKDRVLLHILVATAYENMYPARLDEFAALLAHHFGEAHDDKKTVEYATRAGDLAERVYANAEAIGFYDQALEAAKRIGATSAELIHLYSKRGRVLEVTGRNREALATYEEMLELARARGDRALEIESLLLQGTLRAIPTGFNRDQAIQLADQAEGLAAVIGDQKSVARALWNKLVLHLYAEELTEAISDGNRALELARTIDSPALVAYILGDLARAYIQSGRLEEFRKLNAEAAATWRSIDNWPMLADSLMSSSTAAMLFGDFDAALQLSEEGVELSRTVGSLISDISNKGIQAVIHSDLGNYAEALELGNEMVRGLERRSLTFNLSLIYSQLALVNAYAGSFGSARDLAAASRSTMNATVSRLFANMAWSVLALACITIGDLDGVDDALKHAQPDTKNAGISASIIAAVASAKYQYASGQFEKARDYAEEWIESLGRLGIVLYLPDLLLVQANSLRALGNSDQAYELLGQARVLTERIKHRRTLWQIYALLFEIENERGNRVEAESLRKCARDVIGFIADHTPDVLRAGFLSQPEVQAIVNEP